MMRRSRRRPSAASSNLVEVPSPLNCPPRPATVVPMDALDLAKRQEIGDQFIFGVGYEIGAGDSPSRYRGISSVKLLDKRSPEKLRALFRTAAISDDVRPISDELPEADFVIAHHVLEHSPNPIGELTLWSKLIRRGGRLFISIPAADNHCEKERLPAPFSHLVDDYLFNRCDRSFDSKQHVPHFINQWAYVEPSSFWYSQGDVREFARVSLLESSRDDNDLHWHTFTMDVLGNTIEAGLWFAGNGVKILHNEHAAGAYYVVAEKTVRSCLPACLAREHERLQSALNSFQL
jgi:hypothetical protein